VPAPIEFPIGGLTDGVVRLRLIADADLPAIAAAVQDPEIPRWTTVPSPYTEDDARQWQRAGVQGAAAGTGLEVVIVDADDGTLLGATGLHNVDAANARAASGYWVAAAARGRGVARRGLKLIADFAFNELGMKRIELWIEPANAPSLAVAEAVGFHREGLLRSFAPVKGERRDMLMYSLLPDDAH
jgi:RimJ/RimL family protein N-acetyltransferase